MATRRGGRRRRWLIGGVVAGVVLLAVGAVAAWLFLPETYVSDDWREANREELADAGAAPDYVEHECPFPQPWETTVDCGTLLVPLDRADADSPTIELAVARLHATGQAPAPDPVVYLEGGPGGFAVADHWWWVEEIAEVVEHRDVILVDQRGVGFSDPTLMCLEFWEEPTDDDPLVAELAATRACYERLLEEGNDLAAYSTPAIAADIADLRVSMGLDDINVLGVSYGTRVALALLRDHPEGIRSVVLDSVFPMEVRALEEQVEHAAHAIDLVVGGCEVDEVCAAHHPDLTSKLDEVVERFNEDPATVAVSTLPFVSEDTPFSGDDFVDAIFHALYAPDAFAIVPPAIDAAAAGDMEEALDLLDGSIEAPRRQRWADEDSDGLFYSVTCREDGPVNDRDAAERRAAEVREPLGAALAIEVTTTFDICEFWDAGAATPREAEPVTSAVPTLVLAGSYDPITPAVWAQQVAETLEKATYVEFPELGHAAVAGGPCPVDVIVAFLQDPDAPPDTACATEG